MSPFLRLYHVVWGHLSVFRMWSLSFCCYDRFIWRTINFCLCLPLAEVASDNLDVSVFVDLVSHREKFKNLILQNYWANFNQTWLKASLDHEDASFSNEWQHPFPRGDNRDNRLMSSSGSISIKQIPHSIFG